MSGIQCGTDTAHPHSYIHEEGPYGNEVDGKLCGGWEELCKAGDIFMQTTPTILLKNSPKTGAEPGKGIENGGIGNNFYKCDVLLIP